MLRIIGAVACVFVVGTTIVPHAGAHDLLPKELLDYMVANPEATPEEIDAFMDSAPGAYTDNRDERDRIVQQLRDPSPVPFLDNAYDFIRLGIIHILEGPDHVLFVLSILLAFTSIRGTLKLLSVFTLAHTVTLLLSGSNILRLSAAVVEPIIALSIAYVAITTVFLSKHAFFRKQSHKAVTVFGFGLFHGLGFAGALSDLAIPGERFLSSLIAFNVGVEAGQILIVAVALPVLLLLRRARWHDLAIKAIAVAISTLAIVWTAERLMV